MTTAARYSAADYLTRLQMLLPTGPAWTRDSNAVLTSVLLALSKSFATSDAAAQRLLVEAFPGTADEMLPEWEAALGLPGVYGELAGTTAGRQAMVVAALTDVGDQSKAYFISLAAALGFVVTIDEFTWSSVASPVTAPLYGIAWAHTWRVNAPAASAISYTPTAEVVHYTPNFGNPLLDAVFGAFKPAHTAVVMRYV